MVVFSEGIVAETPQGLTVILGRARDGDERARDELIAGTGKRDRGQESGTEDRKAGQVRNRTGKRDRYGTGQESGTGTGKWDRGQESGKREAGQVRY